MSTTPPPSPTTTPAWTRSALGDEFVYVIVACHCFVYYYHLIDRDRIDERIDRCVGGGEHLVWRVIVFVWTGHASERGVVGGVGAIFGWTCRYGIQQWCSGK